MKLAIERIKTYKDPQLIGEKVIDPNQNFLADKEIIFIRQDNFLPYGLLQYKGNQKVKEVYWKNLKLNNGYTVKNVCF